VVAAAAALGNAARWQTVGLLNLLDRVWPGAAGVQVATAIPYGPGAAQRVDIFVPRGARAGGNAPVILWWHGGGWANGGREVYGFAGRAFAAQGFVTIVAGYRLGPQGRFPAMMQDVAGAVAWARANVARFGGDGNRIVLAGQSAGAHLATLAALDPQWLGADARPGGAVRGVIGLSGPYDFAPFEPGRTADITFSHVADAAQTQPIHFARADAPSMFLATGDADPTVNPRNTRALAAALVDARAAAGADGAAGAGGAVETHYYAGMDHAGTVMALSLPFRGRAPVLADAADFAHRVTRTTPR
ncbi:MAG: alpha/beta hydrolase, partial [Sphingopyxis sp.]